MTVQGAGFLAHAPWAASARAILQNQQAAQPSTESHSELEVDPTFWQDHSVQVSFRLALQLRPLLFVFASTAPGPLTFPK